MKTVKAVDAGDVLLQKRTKIGEKETAGELFDRLAVLGGEAIVEAVKLVEDGKAEFTPQDESQVSHCSMISKEDGQIDFSKSAKVLDQFVRGMTPWPSAYTEIDGKKLKVFTVEKSDCTQKGEVSEVLVANEKQGLIVQAGDSAVRLFDIQLEGGKRMKDTDFLRGRKIELGTRLGK